MILEECKTQKKNLSTAWIDYKKAFDSIPHTWIIKCLEIYGISLVIEKLHHRNHEKLEHNSTSKL